MGDQDLEFLPPPSTARTDIRQEFSLVRFGGKNRIWKFLPPPSTARTDRKQEFSLLRTEYYNDFSTTQIGGKNRITHSDLTLFLEILEETTKTRYNGIKLGFPLGI